MPRSHSSPSAVHDLLAERLELLLAGCDKVMDESAYGRTVHDLDAFLLVEGDKFLSSVLQEKLQERIECTEATPETKECPHCKKKTHTHDKYTKKIVTARGHVTIHRRYRRCLPCKTGSMPAEATLGLTTDYTDDCTRLVSRCCGFWSYEHAAENLKELCGIHLSHVTVGKIAIATAGKLAAELPNNTVIRKDFQKAKGRVEFTTDGTCIHTRNEDGKAEWREMRVGAFAKREVGESATPEEWATRDLPKPTAVSAFAAIESKEEFQKRCQEERRRVGVGAISSALGDGALWIWSLVFFVFGRVSECLDIYHALEHVAACGKALFGSGQAFKDWYERMRLVLLSEGFAGMDRELSSLEKLDDDGQKSVESLREYLRKNANRLNYCERLAAGQSIGSGLIEGACKNLVGRRMKQTGACWRVERANRIAVICALLYSKQWKQAWKNSP